MNDNFYEEKIPSLSPNTPSAEVLHNLKRLSEVFQRIESETSEIAEEIFDYLLNVSDENIALGTIPLAGSSRIKAYLRILNRLFAFSRKNQKNGFKVINRETVRRMDKKTYTISMCHDGGVSLDILCDVVNVENQARVPNASPVKITVKQVFGSNERTRS